MSNTMGEAISSTVVSGWAWLPSDLLYLIVEKLIPITDYIQLGAVCKNWQSVARHQKHQRLKSCHKQLPMLMVSQLCGSSNGWLACVDENLEVTLLNPSTKRTIRLPPFAQVPQPIHKQAYRSDDYIKKVVLSADPSLFPNDYKAVALFDSNGTRVAHIKSGDHGWTHIDQTIRFFYGLNQVIGFDDVIYYRGQFLAASREGGVFAINVSKDPTYKPHLSIVVPMVQGIDDQAYLVESSRGDLLLVRKFQSLNYFECFTETLSF
ncbi:hypothetical protein CerSpe_217070 [Prunus speciosa]